MLGKPFVHTFFFEQRMQISGAVPVNLGSRTVQPALVLQDLVHSRFAGSKGDCVETCAQAVTTARALCSATAMMPLQQDTQAANRADRMATAASSCTARASNRKKKAAGCGGTGGGSAANATTPGKCRDACAASQAGSQARWRACRHGPRSE